MADSKATEASNVASNKLTEPVQSTKAAATKPAAIKPTEPAKPLSKMATVPTSVVASTTQPSKGGDKTVAEPKDPKGMFDYTGCPTYVVKDGDTIFAIAQKYKVALEQLRYFNHLNRLTWQIRTGQTLYIPTKPVHVPTGK